MGRIRFLGGTATVTGSRFLVESKGRSVLVDCGLFQGGRALRQRNWRDPGLGAGRPGEVLITHAHIDHTGFLPRLVGGHGFAGPVRATDATVALMGIMLPDSAKIQEEQAAYANRKGYSRHRPALPLYTSEDADAALALLRGARYHEWFETPVGRAQFLFAGHILGSAHIVLEVEGIRIVFSGDIGRWEAPVIKDPEPPPRADLVVMESTYGDRLHPKDRPDLSAVLAEVVRRVVDRSGILVIPSFAVGRAQEVLYRLRALEDAGAVPRLPVFLDSPMAVDVTGIYRRHGEEHDLEMASLVSEGAGPLRPDRLQFTRSVEESKALNGVEGPAIIISASGMATAGRVLHHLKRLLPHPRHLVAFVGYQAAGTRGRSLVEGAARVKIHGDWIPVRAEVVRLDAFSAHADADELLRWLGQAAARPRRVVLVHGEPDARLALASRIRAELRIDVRTPKERTALAL